MQRYKRIAITIPLLFMLSFGACAKKPAIPGQPTDPKVELLSNIDDVLFSLNEAKPIICQLVPVACAGMTAGLSVAEKIRAAIVEDNDSGAAAFLSALIPVVGQIVDKDINGLTAAQKTTILAALALANIGLHYLSKRLASVEAGRLVTRDSNAGVLTRFNAEPIWGESYRPAKPVLKR